MSEPAKPTRYFRLRANAPTIHERRQRAGKATRQRGAQLRKHADERLLTVSIKPAEQP
jgi:hypothetical protein